MTGTPERKFSHVFEGIVWSMIALPDEQVLVLEIRHHERRTVSFAALQYHDNTFLWRDVVLDEPWWVNLGGASHGMIVFSIYTDTANPDKKGVLAYGLRDKTLRWWNNDFALLAVADGRVRGQSSKTGTRDVVLDIQTGMETRTADFPAAPQAAEAVHKPMLYADNTPYFETVKIFLSRKLNLTPVMALEYLEYRSQIVISYYVMEEELANYLCVWSEAGDLLLHEKTGERLKGIGQEAFFILEGCLIFVKNKRELLSYFL